MINKRISKLLIITIISISILFGVTLASDATEIIQYKSVSGQTRYATSLNIAKEAFPNGSKNVVLVTGTGVPDGLAASALAAKLEAPVILTQSSVLSQDIIDYCVKTKNIFIIGGTGAISKDIENKFIELGKDVYRIKGQDRYSTAAEIAYRIRRIQEIEGQELFDKVFIAKNSSDCIDAANVSVISAKYTIPILYSETSKINQSTLNYVKGSRNIKTVYLVGDGFSEEALKQLEATGKNIEIIQGQSRYETNSKANQVFDSNFDNIILVNNTVEPISISQLGVKENAQLIMVSDCLTDIQKEIIKNNDIKTIYYLNNDAIVKIVKEIKQMKCTNHIAGSKWINDNAGTDHWKTCINCEKTLNYTKCTPGEKRYGDEKNKMQYQICTVCNGKTNIKYLDPNYDYITDGFGRMFPILKQSDPRWGSRWFIHVCTGKCKGAATISTHSCGPASVAMIVSGLTGKVVTPLEYNQVLGVRYKGCNGSNYEVACNSILSKEYGVTCVGIKKDGATSGQAYIQKVIEWTNKGYAVFGYSTAHFMAIIPAGKDRVYILDPAYDLPKKDASGNWISYTAANAISEYKANTKSVYNNYKGKDMGQWYVPITQN